jgi:hypothetical protein
MVKGRKKRILNGLRSKENCGKIIKKQEKYRMNKYKRGKMTKNKYRKEKKLKI